MKTTTTILLSLGAFGAFLLYRPKAASAAAPSSLTPGAVGSIFPPTIAKQPPSFNVAYEPNTVHVGEFFATATVIPGSPFNIANPATNNFSWPTAIVWEHPDGSHAAITGMEGGGFSPAELTGVVLARRKGR